ncbi:NACHT, LRR and PYD domains-containing protein 12-like isoform X1 [Salvelinus namaycush]|uniref:NACHT, LRR and PYD domains-containing protein 12-like isoform X1 n=1 Tax=Salvelinus namaycush TaxID=8040 RepID=A0A8U1FD64_SALNM|nr:NACHT, LRR and PYD domains-containing protein 12-like isoform X1 [Salvelinus namaycush]
MAESAAMSSDDDAQFVDRHMADLIKRVTIVMPIADNLLQRGMIHEEMYSNIRAASTSQQQMRLLYEALKGGVKVKSAFYRVLLEQQPHLVQDLGQPSAVHASTTLNSKDKDKNIEGCQTELKSYLKKTFERIFPGIAIQGRPTHLNKIYTELYITEGGSGEVNKEHEVMQIEAVLRRPATQEMAIKCNDIFKPLTGQDMTIRTVLTKGVAGIGKTVSVQKFILDWVNEEANQDIQFIFPIPFRELNLMKEKTLSLIELLHEFFVEIKESGLSNLKNIKVLFIFDGLDECQLPLSFKTNVICRDVTKSTTVDALLTNLIKRKLLPSALLWITSRPAASNRIPPECVDQVTEVRGFRDEQKEKYFKKTVSNDKLAEKIFTHVQSSRSLHIMCHIPVFCWISATVLERLLSKAVTGDLPKNLTQMFLQFLIFQIRQTTQKYHEDSDTDLHWDKETIMKLGKLAFEELEKSNLIFYEKDLKKFGIDVREASLCSGVFTQILREECAYQEVVYSFVHLSLQEFIAALYVFLSFENNNEDVITPQQPSNSTGIVLYEEYLPDNIYKSAVDKALKSESGHLDLFLRFLLGLSLESNQTFFRGLLTQTGGSSQSNKGTVDFIKDRIRKNPSPERCINLFHCLNELNDHSLVEEIQIYLKSGGDSKIELSYSHWSAMAFVMLSSGEELDVFDLKKFVRSDEGVLRLMPVIKASKTILLNSCNITWRNCENLALAFSSSTSSMRKLDLSHNGLTDTGVELLCLGLGNTICKLETLKLSGCKVQEEGCASLASALMSNPAHLKELDLSYNNPGDSGVKQLSAALEVLHCKLETLSLVNCSLTGTCCEALASALRSNSSSLRELDLSKNDLHNMGLELLSAGLRSINCKLETLRLLDCQITEQDFSFLGSALGSNPSHLRELDLSYNHNLQDSGVAYLSAALENLLCKLETLRLVTCGVTEEGFSSLACALKSNPSHLKQLDLSNNKAGDAGAILLSAALEHPGCELLKFRLCDCGMTEKGWAFLASNLRSNPSHLRELDLSKNVLGDSGVKILSALLEDPHCELKTLRLENCSGECFVSLASALKSNPSHLRELDLTGNNVGDSGVKLLSAGLEDPCCKLEKLSLICCGLSWECCETLAAALSSTSSSLRELNLSRNNLENLGVKRLSTGLGNPHCKLMILRLSDCGMAEEGCASLATALRSNPSHLRELDLSLNSPGDFGMNLLFAMLEVPCCKLDILSLDNCKLTYNCCAALATALSSNFCSLRNLNLSNNNLLDPGVQLLSAGLEKPQCKLEKLELANCKFNKDGCVSLASALRSNPFHLRELDLDHNTYGRGKAFLKALQKDPHCQLEKLGLFTLLEVRVRI